MSIKCVRKASPNAILKLWEAMNFVRQQKQFCGDPRIAGYLYRLYQWSEEDVETTIKQALADGLIVEYNVVGHKGCKSGVEQTGYRIPDEEFDRGQNDWYCTVCHAADCDIQCCRCWRVAHTLCLPNTALGSGRFTCEFCSLESTPRAKKWERSQLKTFLTFIVARLREKGRDLYPLDDEKAFGFDCTRLMYKKIDLRDIEEKVNGNKYSCLPEIIGDVHTILHNICVCVGDEHRLAIAAWNCVEDCKAEVKEIERCRSCYWLYNTKPDNWFVQVCDPPHEMVYAKMKGYPYWPALVISREGDIYDVRFFGGHHQRGLVPSANIKPITTDFKELGIKVNVPFTRASNELQMHQELLAKARQQESGRPPSLKSSNSCDDSSSSSSDLVSSTQDGAGAQPPALRRSPPQGAGQLALSDSSMSSNGPPRKKGRLAKSAATSASHSTSEVTTPNTHDTATPHDSSEHQLNVEKALKQLEDKLQKKFEKETGEIVARITQEAEHRRLEDLKKQKDELTAEHTRQSQDLVAKHKEEISTVKKKQWCYNCEAAAIYHCCWNTAYCSVECQQAHWHKEHKRACRRKR